MKAASGPFSRENTLQLAPFQRKKKKVPFKLPNSRLGELVNGFKTYKKPQKMSATLCTMLENTIRGIFTTTAATVNNGNLLNYDDMREICLRSRELLLNEPCFVLATPPLVIIGDVHGQLFDTLDILNYIGVPPSRRLLFLGDYVDRGEHSLEIITMLLAFKLRFPKEIFLLRGNHETRCVNRQYGFYDECKKKFPKKGVELWTLFQHVFNCLPVAALVGSKIFCAHGGISEDLINFKQFERVYRPTDICDIGMLCDLIWSDPAATSILFDPSPRGVSSTFGKQAVNNFCSKLNVDLICRAHQCVMEGYEFFADKKCLTLFSAPCYCGELDNKAAVLYVSGHLECRVLVFKRDTGITTAESQRTVEDKHRKKKELTATAKTAPSPKQTEPSPESKVATVKKDDNQNQNQNAGAGGAAASAPKSQVGKPPAPPPGDPPKPQAQPADSNKADKPAK